jgi:hypothetical protein
MSVAATGFGDVIRTLGTIGGLVSPLFLLFDRFIRNRPIVAVQRASFYGHPTSHFDLRIFNGSDQAILITGIETSEHWGVAKDDSVEGIIGVVRRHSFSVVVESRGERTFPILIASSALEDPVPLPVSLKVYWRDLRRPGWWTVPAPYSTTSNFLHQLRQAR